MEGDVENSLNNVAKLKVSELKDALEARGLSPLGLKAVLADRLRDAIQGSIDGIPAAIGDDILASSGDDIPAALTFNDDAEDIEKPGADSAASSCEDQVATKSDKGLEATATAEPVLEAMEDDVEMGWGADDDEISDDDKCEEEMDCGGDVQGDSSVSVVKEASVVEAIDIDCVDPIQNSEIGAAPDASHCASTEDADDIKAAASTADADKFEEEGWSSAEEDTPESTDETINTAVEGVEKDNPDVSVTGDWEIIDKAELDECVEVHLTSPDVVADASEGSGVTVVDEAVNTENGAAVVKTDTEICGGGDVEMEQDVAEASVPVDISCSSPETNEVLVAKEVMDISQSDNTNSDANLPVDTSDIEPANKEDCPEENTLLSEATSAVDIISDTPSCPGDEGITKIEIFPKEDASCVPLIPSTVPSVVGKVDVVKLTVMSEKLDDPEQRKGVIEDDACLSGMLEAITDQDADVKALAIKTLSKIASFPEYRTRLARFLPAIFDKLESCDDVLAGSLRAYLDDGSDTQAAEPSAQSGDKIMEMEISSGCVKEQKSTADSTDKEAVVDVSTLEVDATLSLAKCISLEPDISSPQKASLSTSQDADVSDTTSIVAADAEAANVKLGSENEDTCKSETQLAESANVEVSSIANNMDASKPAEFDATISQEADASVSKEAHVLISKEADVSVSKEADISISVEVEATEIVKLPISQVSKASHLKEEIDDKEAIEQVNMDASKPDEFDAATSQEAHVSSLKEVDVSVSKEAGVSISKEADVSISKEANVSISQEVEATEIVEMPISQVSNASKLKDEIDKEAIEKVTKMKVTEIKEQLASRDLSTAGLKSVLVERLQNALLDEQVVGDDVNVSNTSQVHPEDVVDLTNDAGESNVTTENVSAENEPEEGKAEKLRVEETVEEVVCPIVTKSTEADEVVSVENESDLGQKPLSLEEIKAMKVTDLKNELEARGLSTAGLKAALYKRLSLHISSEAESGEDSDKTGKAEKVVDAQPEKSETVVVKDAASVEEPSSEAKADDGAIAVEGQRSKMETLPDKTSLDKQIGGDIQKSDNADVPLAEDSLDASLKEAGVKTLSKENDTQAILKEDKSDTSVNKGIETYVMETKDSSKDDPSNATIEELEDTMAKAGDKLKVVQNNTPNEQPEKVPDAGDKLGKLPDAGDKPEKVPDAGDKPEKVPDAGDKIEKVPDAGNKIEAVQNNKPNEQPQKVPAAGDKPGSVQNNKSNEQPEKVSDIGDKLEDVQNKDKPVATDESNLSKTPSEYQIDVWNKTMKPNVKNQFQLCFPRKLHYTKDFIEDIFSEFGEMVGVQFSYNLTFVSYKSREDALFALVKLYHSEYDISISSMCKKSFDELRYSMPKEKDRNDSLVSFDDVMKKVLKRAGIASKKIDERYKDDRPASKEIENTSGRNIFPSGQDRRRSQSPKSRNEEPLPKEDLREKISRRREKESSADDALSEKKAKMIHTERTISVQDLRSDVGGSTLDRHFSQFGEITNIEMKQVEKSGRIMRGADITFKLASAADKALSHDHHVIDGFAVVPMLANSCEPKDKVPELDPKKKFEQDIEKDRAYYARQREEAALQRDKRDELGLSRELPREPPAPERADEEGPCPEGLEDEPVLNVLGHLKCRICPGAACTGKDNWNAHITGKKHLKAKYAKKDEKRSRSPDRQRASSPDRKRQRRERSRSRDHQRSRSRERQRPRSRDRQRSRSRDRRRGDRSRSRERAARTQRPKSPERRRQRSRSNDRERARRDRSRSPATKSYHQDTRDVRHRAGPTKRITTPSPPRGDKSSNKDKRSSRDRPQQDQDMRHVRHGDTDARHDKDERPPARDQDERTVVLAPKTAPAPVVPPPGVVGYPHPAMGRSYDMLTEQLKAQIQHPPPIITRTIQNIPPPNTSIPPPNTAVPPPPIAPSRNVEDQIKEEREKLKKALDQERLERERAELEALKLELEKERMERLRLEKQRDSNKHELEQLMQPEPRSSSYQQPASSYQQPASTDRSKRTGSLTLEQSLVAPVRVSRAPAVTSSTSLVDILKSVTAAKPAPAAKPTTPAVTTSNNLYDFLSKAAKFMQGTKEKTAAVPAPAPQPQPVKPATVSAPPFHPTPHPTPHYQPTHYQPTPILVRQPLPVAQPPPGWVLPNPGVQRPPGFAPIYNPTPMQQGPPGGHPPHQYRAGWPLPRGAYQPPRWGNQY